MNWVSPIQTYARLSIAKMSTFLRSIHSKTTRICSPVNLLLRKILFGMSQFKSEKKQLFFQFDFIHLKQFNHHPRNLLKKFVINLFLFQVFCRILIKATLFFAHSLLIFSAECNQYNTWSFSLEIENYDLLLVLWSSLNFLNIFKLNHRKLNLLYTFIPNK